jgi:hypothetical protein
MDAHHFDALTRALSGASPRRRLLGALVAAPVLGGLLAVLDPEDTEGKKRRRRRKDRHKQRKRKAQGKRRRRQKRWGCKPKGRAKVCANTCGVVTNRQTCGKPVDCGPCPCTGLNPTDDLQPAIDAAPDGATLTLCPGTWVVPATLQIARPLTIVGAGVGQTILDGGEQSQVIDISADGEVTLQALSITNGTSGTGGGAIRNAANLTLVDAELTANTSTYAAYDDGGGAISSTNALTLRNTIVHGNTSAQYGGGIFVRAGTMTVDDGSSIEMNTAQQGGGIYAVNNSVVTLKTGSRIFKNHAVVQGGGILTRDSTLTLEGGSGVEENTTGDLGFGGGVWTQDSTVTLASGSWVNRNHADNLGGGIYVGLNCEVTLKSGSQLLGNEAHTGGAMYNALEPADGWIVIENGVLICGNSAPACDSNHTWPVAGICPTPVDQCP